MQRNWTNHRSEQRRTHLGFVVGLVLGAFCFGYLVMEALQNVTAQLATRLPH